jgi:hypothetical protein
MNSKLKIAGSILALILIIGGIYYFVVNNKSNQEPQGYRVQKFAGNLIKFTPEGSLELNGFFTIEGEGAPENLKQQRVFDLRIDEDTEFSRSEIIWPTNEEINAMGGRFNLEDLKRKDTKGSLADLKDSFTQGNVFVNAEFSIPIDNHVNNPVSSKILYRIMPGYGGAN